MACSKSMNPDRYGNVLALKGISLEVDEGEVVT